MCQSSTDGAHGLVQCGAEGVILCLSKDVRPRSDEVECDAARRTRLVTSMQEHAGLSDLEHLFDGLQLRTDQFDDGRRRNVVDMLDQDFHGAPFLRSVHSLYNTQNHTIRSIL